MSINRTLLLGNLTRDPELKHIPSGTAVCDASIALNKQWTTDKGEKCEDVTFVDVQLWGKQAESFAKYLGKGQKVFIEGELKQDQWEDKETGKKRSKLFVRCESWQFVDSKKKDDGGASEQDDVPY